MATSADTKATHGTIFPYSSTEPDASKGPDGLGLWLFDLHPTQRNTVAYGLSTC